MFETTISAEDGALGFTLVKNSHPLIIKDVHPESWAARVGIEKDDVVWAMNGLE